jgi:hypothetical protein
MFESALDNYKPKNAFAKAGCALGGVIANPALGWFLPAFVGWTMQTSRNLLPDQETASSGKERPPRRDKSI